MKTDEKILITGAAGFIGSHVTKQAVERGDEIHILTRESTDLWRIRDCLEQVQNHILDVNDTGKLQKTIQEIDPDIVIHLASYGVNYEEQDARMMFKTNVDAYLSLLESLKDINLKKLVFAGSCFEYGQSKHVITEDSLPNPSAIYGVSKAAGSRITQLLGPKYGIPYVVCRIFGVYGPSEADYRIVPYILTSALKNETAKVTSGTQVRDYSYVEDVADGLLKAAYCSESDFTVNICSSMPISIRELIERSLTVAGGYGKIEWGGKDSRQNEMMMLVGDNSLAKEKLGWQAETSLEDGLRKTYKWFQEHCRTT